MNAKKYENLIEHMGAPANISGHLEGILNTLVPSGGSRFLHIGPSERPFDEDLAGEITRWMSEESELKGGELQHFLQHDFKLGNHLFRVIFQHLLQDHWLLRTYYAGTYEQGGFEVQDGLLAFALLRIPGSGDKTFYERERPPMSLDDGLAQG